MLLDASIRRIRQAASNCAARRLHGYGAGGVRVGGSSLITDYGPAGGVYEGAKQQLAEAKRRQCEGSGRAAMQVR